MNKPPVQTKTHHLHWLRKYLRDHQLTNNNTNCLNKTKLHIIPNTDRVPLSPQILDCHCWIEWLIVWTYTYHSWNPCPYIHNEYITVGVLIIYHQRQESKKKQNKYGWGPFSYVYDTAFCHNKLWHDATISILCSFNLLDLEYYLGPPGLSQLAGQYNCESKDYGVLQWWVKRCWDNTMSCQTMVGRNNGESTVVWIIQRHVRTL